MTMPKFEPVAMGHFDFNGECHTVDRNIKATICVGGLSRSKKPLYTEDQLTEAYEAGKRDAIPEGWRLNAELIRNLPGVTLKDLK